MRIHVATDHAGLEFSLDLVDHLGHEGHEVVNHGPVEFDPVDDYPSFCIAAARAVVSDQAAGVDALGVVFGGSGNGEQIAANKVRGARAALVWSVNTAVLARSTTTRTLSPLEHASTALMRHCSSSTPLFAPPLAVISAMVAASLRLPTTNRPGPSADLASAHKLLCLKATPSTGLPGFLTPFL